MYCLVLDIFGKVKKSDFREFELTAKLSVLLQVKPNGSLSNNLLDISRIDLF